LSRTADTEEIISQRRINYSRIGALIIALFLNNFVFFGLIGAKYGENPVDNRLIWYYQFFFNTYDESTAMQIWDYGGLVFVLFIIGLFLTYRENVSLYGIKYTLYFAPITTITSILWYWINTGQLGQAFMLLFGKFQGYFTIFITFIILGFGSFVGLKLKQYSLLKQDTIEVNQ